MIHFGGGIFGGKDGEVGQGPRRTAYFVTLGVKLFRGGEETRAKDAKVKGMEGEEIAGVEEEWVFGLDKELGAGVVGNFMIKRAD